MAGAFDPAADPLPLELPAALDPLELAPELLEPELELVEPVSLEEPLDELELSDFVEPDSPFEPPEAAPAGCGLPEPLAAARESLR
ncbi:MAG: hypothetical protein L0Y54_04855 [Sporichthyaceae bacterium]|nr:hypothetical protein [Sporichthyaceae bacterium]